MESIESKPPRISINKLAEYITAGPARRKTIVHDQKYPPKFKAGRYTETRDGYINYVMSGLDPNSIHVAKEALHSKVPSGDFQINDKASSLDALDCFESIEFPDLSKFELSKYDNTDKLNIGGVIVSVYPDIIFRGMHRNKSIVGALKFHITKKGFSEEARKTAATILHQFIDDFVKVEGEAVSFEHVFSIDVFTYKCEKAPRSYIKRRSDILASCEEYALRWNSI